MGIAPPPAPPRFLQKWRGEILRWTRKLFLYLLQNEAKWQAVKGMDLEKFYNQGRWQGILNALDDHSPHVKKTFKEVVNWYLYGKQYIRAYARAVKDDRSATQNP